MVVGIARILAATVLLAVVVNVRPAAGWSLNPFASSETKTTAKKPTPKKAESSKSFFSKAGETLGLTKPEPRKPTVAIARPQRIQPKSKPKSNSWLPSFLQAEEPKKKENVCDWMTANKRPQLD